MSKRHIIPERIVKLNIGGTFYTSTKTTLSKLMSTAYWRFLQNVCVNKVQGSYLCGIVTGEGPCPKDEKGSYFIDRDGPIFRHILNYLRSDRLTVPFGFREFDILKSEADYYGLPGLQQEIEAALLSRRRSRRRRQRKKANHSQSVNELHRVHEKNGDLYISDEDSDWFYD